MVSSLTLKTALRENTYYITSEMISNLERNTKEIKLLIKERNKLLAKVQTAMDLKAYTKTPLTDCQIKNFLEFTKEYEHERRVVADALISIECKKTLDHIKQELLHNDTDFLIVINELKHIDICQEAAIKSLKNITAQTEKILKSLRK